MRTVLVVVAIAAAGSGIYAYRTHLHESGPPHVTSMAVSRGDIRQTVIATGTVNADRSVPVGTQVSGLVAKVDVDFNDIVHKGELLAEIDPSAIQMELDSARAGLGQAELAENQHEAQLLTDETNAGRAEALFAQALLDDQDRQDAEVQVALDKTLVSQDRAAISVARAAVTGAETDLANCRITSPIDGVVIERDVDVGQTVAARMSAPTMFVLGTDLRRLRVVGDVDESDIAKIRTGQRVDLTVDAYPDTVFHAAVTSTRLNATNAANVVTYQVVADIDNAALRLRPGMTATLAFEIWRAADVLRVPTSALRFRPTREMFGLLHQPPVDVSGASSPALAAAASSTTASTRPSVVPAAGRGAAGATGRAGKPGLIDAFFEAPQPPVTGGQVWVLREQRLTAVPVAVSITDGRWSALVSGDLRDGDQLVTNVVK